MTLRNAVLVSILMACAFLVVGQLYVTLPLVDETARRFGVTQEAATLVGAAFGFAYAAGFLVFGPLSDRFGRKLVLTLGLLAVSIATALVSVAPSFGLLLAARAFQGFAASTFPPVALSLVAESLPPEQRPFGVSLMSFAFLGAAPLAQIFAVQSGQGLPAIMMELAPFYMLGAIVLFFTLKTARAAPASPSMGSVGRLASLLDDPTVLAAWGAAATVLFSFVCFHAGAQALRTSMTVDLQALRLVGLPPLLLTFAAAPLIRRRGAPFTARIGLLLAALASVLALAGTTNFIMMASILLSAGVAFAIPGLIATTASRATNENRGLALAIYSFTLFLGASLAPPVAQSLAQVGTAPLLLLPAGLLMAAALGLTIACRSKPSSVT